VSPFLLLGLVAAGGLLLLSSSTSANASTSSSWPPSAAIQASMLSQFVTYASNAEYGSTGQQPTASELSWAQAIISNAPNVYVQQLPAGQAPTTAGYQTWFWNVYATWLTQSGMAPNSAVPPEPGYTGPQPGVQ
jgi:hypothetical protein